jgi:galactokinase
MAKRPPSWHANPLEPGDPPWSNYVRGVVAGFQQQGEKVGGFDAVIESEVPYGGGLASSAALEVATATLLESLCGRKLEPVAKALLCQKAEHDFARVPCGIMDQFTSVLAQKDHALLLDCRSRTATHLPVTDPVVTVLIINTTTRHRVADTEYASRRAQCETAARVLGVPALRDANLQDLQAAGRRLEPVVFRRARHVISENERTLQATHAIQAADWVTVGRLMYASHDSLRDDYQVSSKELDVVVELAHSLGAADGVIGCRMTGAGFGGCAVALVRTEGIGLLVRKLCEGYENKLGHQLMIFSTRPAAGARTLR